MKKLSMIIVSASFLLSSVAFADIETEAYDYGWSEAHDFCEGIKGGRDGGGSATKKFKKYCKK